eukprot:254591_1
MVSCFIYLLISTQLCICMSKYLNRTIEDQQIANKFWHNFRTSFQGVGFSGVFTDNTILQRGPELSSVYGLADSANKQVSVTLTNMDNNNVETFKTNSYYSTNGSEWKVTFNHPYNAGGNYTLTVDCNGCIYQNSSSLTKLVNITFGDVIILAGQSNMELTMTSTLSRNISYAKLQNGRYKTIRYYKIDAKLPTGTNVTYVIPYSPQYVWNFAHENTLAVRSAFGWYFAETLYDIWNVTDIPIALVDISQGGSHIEEWIQNQTVQLTCKYSDCPDTGCGWLYGMRVAPYLNMTIRTMLWYQGENNICENHKQPGYKCMQSFMFNQMRNQWSVVSGTTNKMFPIGLVTLACGTSEGCDGITQFRSAQMGDYGYTPNPVLPNVYSALGHDLGDPWQNKCTTNGPTPPYACLILNESYIPPWNANATKFFMGNVHPRTKKVLAQRLAQAMYGVLYNNSVYDYMYVGPFISECKLNNETMKIVLSFNKTFLRGNSVDYIPFKADGLSFNYTSAMQVEVNNTFWYYVDIGTDGRENDNEIIVDVMQYKGSSITAISYAYSDCPACGIITEKTHKGTGGFIWQTRPCPMNSMEIRAGGNTNNATDLQLPAVPFMAKIVNNTCVCTAPQTCSG